MLGGDFTARPNDPSIYLKSRRNDILTQMGGVYTFWTSKISTNNFYFSQILKIYVFMSAFDSRRCGRNIPEESVAGRLQYSGPPHFKIVKAKATFLRWFI